MKNSTLGLIAVAVIVVGGGGGCIIRQQMQTPAESTSKQAPAPKPIPEPVPAPAPVDTTSMKIDANEGGTTAPTPAGTEKVAQGAPGAPGGGSAPSEPVPGASATTAVEGSATAAVTFTGPDNAAPADKKEFTADEAKGSVAFRWTALVPKPKEPVTYRLRVWQLMQGQNGTQAMKANQPIVTKDVDDQTQATVSGIYTGPCKPPYLCDFIWAVEATTGVGVHAGMSDPTTFSVMAEAADDASATGSADGTR